MSGVTPEKEHHHFDVIIVGAGMVGGALACGLLQQGLSVAIIEKSLPAAFNPTSLPDLRVSAINPGSEQLLRDLNAWDGVAAMRSQPYRRLAVWERLPEGIRHLFRGQPNKTEFSCDEVGTDHLGYIVENRVIQLAVQAVWQTQDRLTLYEGYQLTALEMDSREVRLKLQRPAVDDHVELSASLLIGADGAMSAVRQLAGIGLSSDAYSQHAMVISVETEGPAQDITWQEFTPAGPRAFLPLPANGGSFYASLVWYDSPDQLDRLMALSDSELMRTIAREFPATLPSLVRVLERGRFPLVKRHAQQYVRGRVVLAGDAAHTINPLAGQGVNLGFQDVQALLETLENSVRQHQDPGFAEGLEAYQRQRRPANLRMMATMDGFYYAFSNNFAPLRLARNLGLTLAGRAGPAKRRVLQYAMGLNQ